MSEPPKTSKKAKSTKQTKKESVKSKPNGSLYATGDIEDMAYSERSERYSI